MAWGLVGQGLWMPVAGLGTAVAISRVSYVHEGHGEVTLP